MRRVVIGGAGSHCGKTTIACALLAALRARGFRVSAYKTGPDYIDPQYLRRAGGCEAYNLDTWLMNETLTRELFAKTSREISIIEGAMGLYDGNTNSTAGIAKLLKAPVVLVIDAKSLGESASAVALGFREYDREVNFAGVILNRVGSDYHAKIIADSLRDKGIKLLGVVRRDEGLAIPERHLGLVPVDENGGQDLERLAHTAESCLDIPELVRISESAPALNVNSWRAIEPCFEGVRVGVARDEAFTFYYPESLGTLEELGAELVNFSPIHDEVLPEADGYIFGGGFPEMFARELSGNASMLRSVRECVRPVLGECGGMMYLCRSMTDLEGEKFAMAGVVPCETVMKGRAVLGYMEACALRDNLLCRKGEVIRGHEFHYSGVVPEIPEGYCAFTLTRRNTNTSRPGGYAHKNILATYLHTNFFGNLAPAQNFLHTLTSSRV